MFALIPFLIKEAGAAVLASYVVTFLRGIDVDDSECVAREARIKRINNAMPKPQVPLRISVLTMTFGFQPPAIGMPLSGETMNSVTEPEAMALITRARTQ